MTDFLQQNVVLSAIIMYGSVTYIFLQIIARVMVTPAYDEIEGIFPKILYFIFLSSSMEHKNEYKICNSIIASAVTEMIAKDSELLYTLKCKMNCMMQFLVKNAFNIKNGKELHIKDANIFPKSHEMILDLNKEMIRSCRVMRIEKEVTSVLDLIESNRKVVNHG